MLALESVSKLFGARALLNALSCTISHGEYVAIVGQSGCGKSTLLNLIAGLDMPDAGRIEIDGTDITRLSEDARTQLRRAKVGFVFQAFHVLPHLTVAQNVALPLVLLDVAPSERVQRVTALLREVGLEGRADSWPRELSGGELQRVALARALVHRPALVLADEPTGNLDPETARSALSLLARSIRATNAAGVLVTHSMEATAMCDRVLRLERGTLVAQ
jgi:putative ABC transport system ATP-binding protein